MLNISKLNRDDYFYNWKFINLKKEGYEIIMTKKQKTYFGTMENNIFHKNIGLIKEAHSILTGDKLFPQYYTISTQMSYFKDVPSEDYKKLDYKLKAIRQDFSKIFITISIINKTFHAYQKDKYIPAYKADGGNQAAEELECLIEYLFAKYRVILEYIQQILEICIPPKFNEQQKIIFSELKKGHKKYNFLLKHIFLNFQWIFQFCHKSVALPFRLFG